ncbi:hypothetical protein EYF80_028431 [Liparis tanakae]|uniref:Uncharacterized protein n=1 Tax=Liparis tanakae TaxID=230148 RepID=A0A4Z2H973_9TELE|nr:hypothetical protein EYF80_028431 [Liparis tanakae]
MLGNTGSYANKKRKKPVLKQGGCFSTLAVHLKNASSSGSGMDILPSRINHNQVGDSAAALTRCSEEGGGGGGGGGGECVITSAARAEGSSTASWARLHKGPIEPAVVRSARLPLSAEQLSVLLQLQRFDRERIPRPPGVSMATTEETRRGHRSPAAVTHLA